MSRQLYWGKIQDVTEANLAKTMQEAIDRCETNHALSVRIRNQVGGFEARMRAEMIARTETTLALSAGHEAEREEVAETKAKKMQEAAAEAVGEQLGNFHDSTGKEVEK